MKAVASSVFRTMMFPHNKNIITIDQVSHYESNPSTNIDNILPLIHTSHDAYPLIEIGPEIFKDPSLLGTYHGAPPLLHPSNQVCVVSSNRTDIEDTLPPREASIISDVPLVTELPPHEPPVELVDPTSPRFHISPRPYPSLGDSSPSHYSNPLLLPSTRRRSFPSSRNAYPP
jgi:hypothetical protein